MTKKIFISYSRRDAPEAQRLLDVLQLIGYEVWLDQARLRIGENWWSEILAGIRNSAVVICVVSPAWLASEACKAEAKYAMATNRRLLTVLTDQITPSALPHELAGLHAGPISNITQISAAIEAAPPVPLPERLPEPPPMPLGWAIVQAVVRTTDHLDADVQSPVVGFLVTKARSPVLKERRLARRLAGEFRERPDATEALRAILDETFGPGRAIVFPVIGALLGGLALTHLLWVTSSYLYLDGLVDQLTGFSRGTARGVLAVNFLLGVAGLVLCGVAVHRRVRNGKVALAICSVGLLGVFLDALLKVQWPFVW